MIDKECLVQLSELDDKTIDEEMLLDNMELLEKTHSNIHGLLIKARMKKLMRDFGQKETNVYVVSFPRSGTTLMQMLLYQMTTNGNMDFEHIYDVSPWCRYAALFNQSMKSVGKHRIIKSHDSYEMFEGIKKGKFIFVLRDCLDVVSSIYQQSLDYIDRNTDFDQLSDRNIKRWFDYNLEWSENKNKREILFVHYEDLIENKAEVTKNISKFLGIEVDHETLKRVLYNTSFEFMKKHQSKFGEQPDHQKVYNNFIRKGESGEGKNTFTNSQLQAFTDLTKSYKTENTPLERYFKIY